MDLSMSTSFEAGGPAHLPGTQKNSVTLIAYALCGMEQKKALFSIKGPQIILSSRQNYSQN